MNQTEVWKPVLDYEGLYEVSNLGNVKSFKFGRENLLKPNINKRGYYFIILSKQGKSKNFTIHRLVWEAFNGKTSLDIDHIVEGNKLDNRLINLQAISRRQNVSKYCEYKKMSSSFTGVCWSKKAKKWFSSIHFNKKTFNLGFFEDELVAAKAYIIALNTIKIYKK